MFSVYSEKAILLFPKNMKLPLCQKSKDGLLPEKYTQILTFPASLKKIILILKKMILVFQVDILDHQWFSVLLWRSCIQGVIERQLRKIFVQQEIGYNFKNIRVVALVRVEVIQTFLKVRSENLVKVTRIGKVMGRKRRPTLRELSFKFHH